MTTTQKIIGLVSGALAGVLGASVFAALLLGAVSCWLGGSERVAMRLGPGPGPGLAAAEMVALIFGLAIGFGAGVTAWSLVSTRMGWFTWEQILELTGRSRS
jgi:hypothetical protein